MTDPAKTTPFAPAPQRRASAATIALATLGVIMILGGMYLVSLAFSMPGKELWFFIGGILVSCAGFYAALGFRTRATTED